MASLGRAQRCEKAHACPVRMLDGGKRGAFCMLATAASSGYKGAIPEPACRALRQLP
jgi:hypothetical protein